MERICFKYLFIDSVDQKVFFKIQRSNRYLYRKPNDRDTQITTRVLILAV